MGTMSRIGWVLGGTVVALIAGCGGGTSSSIDANNPAADARADAPPPDAAIPTVTVTVLNHPVQPSLYAFFVAYQDGDGAWTLATRGAGDTYTFPVSDAAGRYAVAMGCVQDPRRNLDLWYATVGELPSFTALVFACGDGQGTTANLTITPANRNSEPATFAYDGGIALAPDASGNYDLSVHPGVRDLLAARGNPPDLLGRSNDLTIAGNKTLAFDFATQAAAPELFTITMTPASGETPFTSVYLTAANGSAIFENTSGSIPTVTGRALATGLRRAGDVYTIDGYVTKTGYVRETIVDTDTPVATTLDLPPAMTGVTDTVVSTTQPYVRIGTSWDAYAGAQAFEWRASQSSTFWITHIITSGWLAGANTWQMPNLSSLPGWDSRYPLVTGAAVTVALTVFQTTGPITEVLGTRTAGSITKVAATSASVTP